MVVLILYYVEKFVREDFKNFGLDMTQEIVPGTSQFILCMSNWVLGANFCCNLLNAHILTGYVMKIKLVPKKYNESEATPIRGVSYFL